MLSLEGHSYWYLPDACSLRLGWVVYLLTPLSFLRPLTFQVLPAAPPPPPRLGRTPPAAAVPRVLARRTYCTHIVHSLLCTRTMTVPRALVGRTRYAYNTQPHCPTCPFAGTPPSNPTSTTSPSRAIWRTSAHSCATHACTMPPPRAWRHAPGGWPRVYSRSGRSQITRERCSLRTRGCSASRCGCTQRPLSCRSLAISH